MIGSQGYLTVWRIPWVPSVLSKNYISEFLSKWINFEITHSKHVHCPLTKISLHSLAASWLESGSLSPTVQLHFSKLTLHMDFTWTLEMSDRQNDRFARTSDSLSSSLDATWHHPEKIQTLRNLFRDKQILKEEPINICKLYDNEGTTLLSLRSDHFINPTVWHLVFGLNFMTSILVMISFHKGI